MAFLANAWVVTVMLLGSPWISREALEEHTALVKEGFAVVLPGAVLALAAIANRYRLGRWQTLVQQGTLAAGVLGVVGIVLLVSGRTPVVHADQSTVSVDPGWHGAYLGRPLALRHRTLAEILRSKAYWKAAAVANVGNLQPSLGLSRGFSIYDWGKPVGLSHSNCHVYLRELAQRVLRLAVNTDGFRTFTFRAGDVTSMHFDCSSRPSLTGPLSFS
jgi:hypothetical protein